MQTAFELRRLASGLDAADDACVWWVDTDKAVDALRACADLVDAVQRTLLENAHLADGDVCTLIHLKRALQPNDQGNRSEPR